MLVSVVVWRILISLLKQETIAFWKRQPVFYLMLWYWLETMGTSPYGGLQGFA